MPRQQEGTKAVALCLAETVRSIEQGLTSFVTLNLGITLVLSGSAIVSSRVFPGWFGWTAVVVGGGYLVSSLSFYYLGFSQHAVGFWSGILLAIWVLGAGLLLWRESHRRD
ncbi:MAG TPA: hypothetical protein VGR25_03875 [bacterium]|jgi:hypothetical protein|nr:hypothetical protein [bacterium]